jgi:hypothetical protein
MRTALILLPMCIVVMLQFSQPVLNGAPLDKPSLGGPDLNGVCCLLIFYLNGGMVLLR